MQDISDIDKSPNHLINIVVFILVIIVVVFLMSRNQPTRVDMEKSYEGYYSGQQIYN